MIERVPSVRVLLLFFSFLARVVEAQFTTLRGDLRGGRIATTYHGYLAWTFLYAAVSFVLVMATLVVASTIYVRPDALTSAGVLPVVIGITFPSFVISYGVYRARLYYPRYVASERAREIELSLPNVTNFLLALSRAGVPTATTLTVIGEHTEVLGEAANEFRYAARDMKYFGSDVVTSLTNLSRTTPLAELSDFVDGYVRSLTGRGDVDMYLEDRMEKLFDDAKIEQENYLSSLGVLAEVYVALFVAFPIFALIILIVMGFIGAEGIIVGIRVVVYAVVPLTAIAFLVLLDMYMTNPLAGSGRHVSLETTNLYDESLHEIARINEPSDAHSARSARTFAWYRRKQTTLELLSAPMTLLRREPIYALYLGCVLGVVYFATKVGIGMARPAVPFVPVIPPDASILEIARAIDTSLVEALMIVLLTYSVFFEMRARYLSGIERSLPDFLNELADRHQIGMSLSESLRTLRDRDLGSMNQEIDRMSVDFRLNANATDVLKRFANRVRSPIVTRVVVLLSAANDTADRLEPVIEALAKRAELMRQLKRERQVEMSLYVIIIYISFFVFLVILMILHDVFLPQIPTEGTDGGVVGVDDFDPTAYEMIFFHMSVVQGFFSGLVGGKMSEGTVSAGVKHALVMIMLTYLIFVVILPSVAIQL